jgi:RimJ/RimL family protein N-acetyltransferase
MLPAPLPPDLRIETPRLVLRPLGEGDLDALVGEIGDARVVRMLARVPFPYRAGDARAFLAASRDDMGSGTGIHLSIISRQRLVGGISIATMPRVSEFGYWLGHAHWGRGFATEAGRALLSYGFAVLGLRLVRSGAFTDNPASMRVQRKLGFLPTGRSKRLSLARRAVVAHIDTVVTRQRFEALLP